MKKIQLLLIITTVVATAFAEDITLTDGRILNEAKITSETPTHVTIRHKRGINQVSKAILSEELRAKYPIDEIAAEAAKKRDAVIREEQRLAAIAREQKLRTELAEQKKRDEENAQRENEMKKAAMEASASSYQIVTGQFLIERRDGRDVGMTGMRIYFCTPDAWDAYQEKRRQQFESDYMKMRAEIVAQGYDVNGESAASNGQWLAFRRWHRSTYEELPEFFATTESGIEGRFSLHVSQRPFVMFARSERAVSAGNDYLVWIEHSNSFQPGAIKTLSRGNAKRSESGKDMPRRSPVRSGFEI